MRALKNLVLGVGSLLATAAIFGACSSETQTVQTCGAGSQACNGVCTVVARDVENCGACGTKCGAGEVCSQGTCSTTCVGGTTKCGNVCANTKSDGDNCGTCGKKCDAGQVCSNGACATSCGQGLTQCGQSCVNQQTDRANCGACGTTCAAGEVCNAGTCELSCQPGLIKCTAAPSDGGVSDASSEGGVAEGGSTLASTFCANPMTDNTNCGACGTKCAQGQVCSLGTCALQCGGGTTKCGSTCNDLTKDPSNCGTCGNVCPQGNVCSAGSCSLQCAGGSTKCGSSCVTLQSDPANCGGCGVVCGQGKACVGGLCKPLLLYTFSGPLANVPIASLTGWSQCYLDLYSNGSTSLATIQAACSQANILVGCRLTGSNTLAVAAHAPRTDVFFDTGNGNVAHNANGSGWYYTSSLSWGFAPQGSPLNRNSCDVTDSASYPGGGASDGALRLCWHTNGGTLMAGWRCGKPDFLGGNYERVIYQAP